MSEVTNSQVLDHDELDDPITELWTSNLRVEECTREIGKAGVSEIFIFEAANPKTSEKVRITIGLPLMMDIHHCLVSIGNLEDVTRISMMLEDHTAEDPGGTFGIEFL